MIRGINRQIIEVTDINNAYYEKAFLVIKPEHSNYYDKALKKEARKLVENIGNPSLMNKKSEILSLILKLCLAAGIGAGLAAIVIT